ncbi:MAG: MFS transporter [Gammaproteobacteria bacterium]|jgi:MFS family permease|nr:MFS transporter [Gammaproteobacteria bacterium]NCW56374.1 MFS transporter [Gammaproteobacteria bacterium]NDA43715.1 MFS transporter [Gammaproteobacteria bacterium]
MQQANTSGDHAALSFDRRFVALAVVFLGAAFFVPPLFRGAVIALAIVAAVLAALPQGTRGLVFSTMIGLATGIASVNLFAIGIFQGPITQEFGWSQTQYALVTLVGTVVTVVSSLYIGKWFDRQGVRRWALAGVVLVAASMMSLYWLSDSLLHFYAVFALMPLIGAGTSSIAYSRVIAAWFDRRRGQAFGAALAGIGIGGAVLSAYSQYLIGTVGWRGAYVGLGVLMLVVTLPIIFMKLRDSPADVGLGFDGVMPDRSAATPAVIAPSLVGYGAAESRRTKNFWLMFVSFLLLAFGIGGVLIPLVPILRARGIEPEQAAAVQAALGLALIVGRAFAGFLMDRFFAPRVAAVILVFPLIGVSMLALDASGTTALVAAVCIGVAAGAELDVIAVLVTRYFGNRAYGENYGWQYAAWTLGSGTAVIVTNRVFDQLGTHTPVLWVYVAMFLCSALLILRLGAYPDLTKPTTRNL